MSRKYFYTSITILVCLTACQRPVKPGKLADGTLPFYSTPDFTPQWIAKSSKKYDSVHTIDNFSFVNQYGETISNQTLEGKIYVADFFFTSCPGICKKLTTNLSLVQKAFEKDTTVLLVSYSVTPETDNVDRLNKYALASGVIRNKWHLLTGDHNKIYRLARESYFADEDMGVKKSTNDFLHTENMLLIDKHQRIRGVYKGTSVKDINDLIADIKTLEAEK